MSTRQSTWNLPNVLTVARIVAIPIVVALVLWGPASMRWVALALYVAAAVTDYLDGYLARTMGQVSPLGRMLDPIADKLLVGALLLVFAFDGTFSRLDLIPALAILMREIFVSGLREFLGSTSVVMPVSTLAKYKTTVQLAALGLAMAVPLVPALSLPTSIVLWLAGLLTLWTGWSYWRGAQPHLREPAP